MGPQAIAALIFRHPFIFDSNWLGIGIVREARLGLTWKETAAGIVGTLGAKAAAL
jgi:adenosyl cobinamide kinase/adenosyl cobinamide phosphate guanylyltransferase